MSHGVITQAVHAGVQAGRGAATGRRGFAGRGSSGIGSEPQRSAPLAAGVSPWSGERVSGWRQAAVVRRKAGTVGAEDRAADSRDRFFKKLLAAHRTAADAAGSE